MASMVSLLFISRHRPNNGQVAMLEVLGYEDFEQMDLLFGDNPIEQVQALGLRPGAELAIVAPTAICLALLRAGYRLIEFVNEPSSRQKGVFVCRGAWRHTLAKSEFLPCPLPPEEQEAGDLSPRKEG